MPRPSQENKILEAALRCFAEKGYEGTTIRHIAAAAGVTEGAIYRHYPTKEAVAQSLFTHYLTLLANQLQEIAQSEQSVKARLQLIVQSLLDQYRENPAAATFVLLRQHNFMPNLPPGFVYPLEIVEAVMKEGQAAKLVRAGKPNLLAAILLGSVLQPIILSQLAAPGAFELLAETEHDAVIKEAAWAAVCSDSLH